MCIAGNCVYNRNFRKQGKKIEKKKKKTYSRVFENAAIAYSMLLENGYKTPL